MRDPSLWEAARPIVVLGAILLGAVLAGYVVVKNVDCEQRCAPCTCQRPLEDPPICNVCKASER